MKDFQNKLLGLDYLVISQRMRYYIERCLFLEYNLVEKTMSVPSSLIVGFKNLK